MTKETLEAVERLLPEKTGRDPQDNATEPSPIPQRKWQAVLADRTGYVQGVDHLSAILSRLATKEIPSSHRHENGELRLIAIGETFAGLVADSFDEIRGSSGGNAAIMLRMLEALETVAGFTECPSRRKVLQNRRNKSPNWPDIPLLPQATGIVSRGGWHRRARFSMRRPSITLCEIRPSRHRSKRKRWASGCVFP